MFNMRWTNRFWKMQVIFLIVKSILYYRPFKQMYLYKTFEWIFEILNLIVPQYVLHIL
jgi:hypothetical protein